MIIDTNVFLRYVLNDNESLSKQSADIIENNEIFLPTEIIAEIVYVLEKVYKVPRKKTAALLTNFIDNYNPTVQNPITIKFALSTYSSSKLDFIDCMIHSYHHIESHEVVTFDKALNKKLK